MRKLYSNKNINDFLGGKKDLMSKKNILLMSKNNFGLPILFSSAVKYKIRKVKKTGRTHEQFLENSSQLNSLNLAGLRAS